MKCKITWAATGFAESECDVPQHIIQQGGNAIAQFMQNNKETKWSNWEHSAFEVQEIVDENDTQYESE